MTIEQWLVIYGVFFIKGFVFGAMWMWHRMDRRVRKRDDLLDFAYHLRFVDDSNSHDEQMEYWKEVEQVIDYRV